MLTSNVRAQLKPAKLAKRSGAYERGDNLQIVVMFNRVRCLLLFKSREELQC